MTAVEKALFLFMLGIISGMFIIIFVIGMEGAGYKKIKHKLITAMGSDQRSLLDYRLWKRLFDLTLGFMSTIILLPIMLIISMLLKVNGIKKILKRRECIGINGRKIIYYIFNTERGDGRQTKFGNVIERMGIVTFPLSWSLLKGDLTAIGLSRVSYDVSDDEIKELYRYEKPGMVAVGSLFKIDGESRTDVDKMYLKARNIALDIDILFFLVRQTLTLPGK